MPGESESDLIDAKIQSMGDWRGAVLARMRRLIREADPEVVEEVKWRKPSNPSGVPTWSHAGLICTGETYRDKVKLTFARGADLPDPKRLFNSSLEGNVRRAVARNRAKGLPADFEHLTKVADETRNYIPKLQAIKNIVADPAKFGLVMDDVPNAPPPRR